MKFCLLLFVLGLVLALNEAKKSKVFDDLDESKKVNGYYDIQDQLRPGDTISVQDSSPKGPYVMVVKDSNGNVKAWYHTLWKGIKWGVRKLWDRNVDSILKNSEDFDDDDLADELFA